MKNKKRKKPKIQDIVMDCIIVGVIIVFVILIVSTAVNRHRKNHENTKEEEETAQEEQTGQGEDETQNQNGQEGDLHYLCVTAEENNDTVFMVTFAADGTYTMSLQASTQKTVLEQGSYTQEEGKFIVVVDGSETETVYAQDGDYLIVEDELYEGEVPEGDTFDAECTYEVPGQLKRTITFHSDGSYEQELISFALEGSSDEDTTDISTGTYTREGKFLTRVPADGQSLLDFYIYNNRLSNAYYLLEE